MGAIGVENQISGKVDERHAQRIVGSDFFKELRSDGAPFLQVVENADIEHLQSAIGHFRFELHLP